MSNPIQTIETDAAKVLAENKSVMATLETDEAKVKVFWLDYRAYIVCAICFLIGAFVGHKL